MIEELRAAWQEWDLNPGDPGCAGRMESACWKAAKELDIKVVDLRKKIAEGRRQGYGRTEVLGLIWLEAAKR